MHSLKNISAIYKIYFLLGCTVVIHACVVLPHPVSTPVPGVVDIIVAGTAAAAQTQTALVLPSLTTTPTLTPQPTETIVPTETPTPTATVIFNIHTATFTPTATSIHTATKQFEIYSAGSDCELVAMTPYNPILAPGTSFNMQWTIKNTSDNVWGESDIDFRYSGGTDMHKKDIYDLPESVHPNGSVNLIVLMVSPNKPGTYTTTWKLSLKKDSLCQLSATIIVK